MSLIRDNRINLGFDYNLTRTLDLSAGYSRSVYSYLNTFSFSIQASVDSLLKKSAKDWAKPRSNYFVVERRTAAAT